MSKVVRISKELLEAIKTLYADEREGAERAIEGFIGLRGHTLHTLKGMFTTEELTGLVSSFNSTMMEPKYLCSTDMFLAHLDDSEKLDNFSHFYKFSYKALREKAQKLSAAQVFFLQEEIHRFWNQGSQNLVAFLASFE